MDTGLLLARLVLGLAMAAHGSQKLFGWFGGHGLRGTAGFFEGLGFRPGPLFAMAAGLGELAGGGLTALGLLGPIGPGLVILTMVVAMASVHWSHGFFAMTNGVELPLVYATGAWALAIAGPGALSLDRLLGLTALSTPTLAWVAGGAALLGAALSLLARRFAPSLPVGEPHPTA